MTELSSQNTRLLKNTIFLYFRMIFLMIIGFYTSRIVLQKLGVEDFGIYNLVGGIVASVSSIRTLFSNSIQRFLNVAMGKGNKEEMTQVCNGGFLLNLCISAIILLLLLTVGLWFLYNKLIVPDGRLEAAVIVFICSVFTATVSIFTTFYEGIVIAYEKMDFYAYVSLIEGGLKLGILYLLYLIPGDKLVVYGFLMLAISLINLTIYRTFCSHKLEVHISMYRGGKQLLKEMAILSGWNFCGNIGATLVNEGINFLLNIFGGVVLNAARGVANQLSAILFNFVNNIITSIKPQIIKSYGANDIARMRKLIVFSSRVMYFLYLIIAIPVFVWADELLALWLGVVPDNAVSFVRCLLLYYLSKPWHNIVGLYYITIGKMKGYQLIDMIRSILVFAFAWIVLKIGFEPYSVFLVMAIFEFFNVWIIMAFTRRYGESPFQSFFTKVAIPSYSISIMCIMICYLFDKYIFIHFFFEILITVIINVLIIYCLGFSSRDRGLINSFVLNKIRPIFR